MFVVLLLIFHWTQSQSAQKTPNNSNVDAEIATKLLGVKRIYVDSFGDDLQSKQLQAMVMSSLAESKKFIITENKEKADAVLKGSGLEKTSQELHATSEGTAVGAAAAGHSASISGSNGSISGSSVGGAAARTMAIQDAQASTETINDAHLAVRLVSQDGDVIWATTKESKGAKYKGASADVAAQIVKQLMWDLEKAAKQRESTTKDSN
jgi:hypothetical protein